MTATNYSKPLTIGSILEEAKRLFFDNSSAYTKIFLVFLLPLVIAQGIGQYVSLLISTILLLVALVFSITGSIAIILQTNKYVIGEKTFNFETLKKESWSYFWRYVGLALGIAILLFLLLLLLIIPGIIFAIFWAFALFALLLKNTSVSESLKYSKKLVKGRWWQVLGYLLVFGLFSFVLAIPLILLSAAAVLVPTILRILFILIYSAGIYVLSMYFTVVQVVFFKNMDAMYGEKTPVKKE